MIDSIVFKSHNNDVKSTKLGLDKYYTPVELSKKLIDLTVNKIGLNNISQFVEPSAGSGSFSDILNDIIDTVAIDIEPDNINITKADYLSYNLPYKKGRCVIGNPPFGSKMLLAREFLIKLSQKVTILLSYCQSVK